MTFSDRRIVKFVNEHFVPVWESAAPVTVATFDLGEGASVTGTVGGEIALYFCRPDGLAFDVLPALQSPRVTLEALKEALKFWSETGATESQVMALHRGKVGFSPFNIAGLTSNFHELGPLVTSGQILQSLDDPFLVTVDSAAKRALKARHKDADLASRDLATMAFSKVVMTTPAETIVVSEPGGLGLYRHAIHSAFAAAPTLRTPAMPRTRSSSC